MSNNNNFNTLTSFLPPVNPRLERHFDLSAILGLAEPLEKIPWPEVKLDDNQFLVAYRGEAPMQVLGKNSHTKASICLRLPRFEWWQQGVLYGIYLVTLPLRKSGDKTLFEHMELCESEGGSLTPFILNAMVCLAHMRLTSEPVGGWIRCLEFAGTDSSTTLVWHGSLLSCSYSSVNNYTTMLASSSKRLAGLP